MGFSDTYTEPASNFVGKEEKQALIDDETVLNVVDVYFNPNNKFEGETKPQYVVKFTVEDDAEVRAIGLGAGVSSRDDMLAQMQDYLNENEGETIPVVLYKVKRTQLLKLV